MDLRFFASPIGQAIHRTTGADAPATVALRTTLEDGYYVGRGIISGETNPGIIGGPFNERPKQVSSTNVLYRKTTTGSWVKDPVGFATQRK